MIRNTSDEDQLCPGDTVSFHCKIFTSLALQLEWRVTFPGDVMPQSIILDNTTTLRSSLNLGRNVSTTLQSYEMDSSIQSEIVLTVLQDVGEIKVECRFKDIVNESQLFSGKSLLCIKSALYGIYQAYPKLLRTLASLNSAEMSHMLLLF